VDNILGEQNSNYHRLEKLKNEMISRRDDEDVLNILQGGATKKSAIFELPCGRGRFAYLLRCSSLTYIKYASLLAPSI